MKILHLSIIIGTGIGSIIASTILFMYVINLTPHAEITIEGLQDKYNVGEKLDFSVIAKGYGSYCNGPYVEIYNATNQSQMFWGGSYVQYTGMYCNPHNFEFVFHVGEQQQYSISDKVPIILEKPGTYLVKTHIQTHLITSNSEQEFSVIPQENLTAELENNEGIVTLRNQTYYFETPNYSHDAYFNSPQISFHDVTFTLFPSGFRGGLPIPCNNQGMDQYYWTDVKFTDNTHELLHMLVYSPPCTNTIPTIFSNHTNPQAGLIFYDDKMKLLVSTNVNSTALQTMPKLTYMNIKVFSSYTPSSLADHFLSGSLNSTDGPILNGNVTITVNGIVMGTTGTYPSGCFQFNDWNDSKLAGQINKSISLGDSSTELNFQAQYFGDSNHNPANASAISYLSLYAVPLAPAQYDTEVYPSDQINVTQGDSTQFHLTVKAFSKYWEVEHMKLNLQRTPCGLSYHISPVDNNDSVLVNNTASFNVILNTTSYTPSGKYWISIDQDLSGINEPNIGANVGTFYLNVLKK